MSLSELASRPAAFLLHLECLDRAALSDAFANEVIQAGGTYIVPTATRRTTSHLVEISLYGVTGRGTSEAAAIADWRAADTSAQKIKKDGSGEVPPLALAENPDILASVAKSAKRPPLLVGFAAETNDVIAHAQAKLARKGCDLIVANDVSADPMGGETNRVHIVSKAGIDSWDRLPKEAVARKLMEKIADELDTRVPLADD